MPLARRLLTLAATGLGLFVAVSVGGNFAMSAPSTTAPAADPPAATETATFGNGCFWCTEAVFQRLKGVQSVVSGYSGGTAIQVTFDPKVISYEDILAVFWHSHDPTTLNRQGNDFGPQYRSVIFYQSEKQQKLAEEYKKKLDASAIYRAPIVTEIVPFSVFYRAEDYHQNYYNEHKKQPYCRAIIGPKLDKLKKVFHDKLKSDDQH
jgi:peptide-methionine (S)-S-oxide reductase